MVLFSCSIVVLLSLNAFASLNGFSLGLTGVQKELKVEDIIDPQLSNELDEIAERETKTIERISALVGDDYAKDEADGKTQIIQLTLIQAAVLALQEINANSLDPMIRGRHLDKKKFTEVYEKNIKNPCKKLIQVYEKYSVNIEHHWTTNPVPYLRREGRLKIWANDCAYLVDHKTIDEILSELSSLVASSKPSTMDNGSKHGCLKFYSQRRAS